MEVLRSAFQTEPRPRVGRRRRDGARRRRGQPAADGRFASRSTARSPSSIIAPEFFLPLRTLAHALPRRVGRQAAAERHLRDPRRAGARPTAPGETRPVLAGPVRGPRRAAGDHRSDRVTVTYPGRDRPAVAGLSLTIPAGARRRRLVGPTGRRQVDGRRPAAALPSSPTTGRSASGGRSTAAHRRWPHGGAGRVGAAVAAPLPRHGRRQPAPRPPRRERGGPPRRRDSGRARRRDRRPAGRPTRRRSARAASG